MVWFYCQRWCWQARSYTLLYIILSLNVNIQEPEGRHRNLENVLSYLFIKLLWDKVDSRNSWRGCVSIGSFLKSSQTTTFLEAVTDCAQKTPLNVFNNKGPTWLQLLLSDHKDTNECDIWSLTFVWMIFKFHFMCIALISGRKCNK